MKRMLVAVMVAVAVTGCATTKKASLKGFEGPPWVLQGSGAFEDGNLYGVGKAQGIGNKALLIDASESDARAELAAQLNSSTDRMRRTYVRSTTGGDGEALEQDTLKALQELTTMDISGAVIIDRWQDPSDGTMYALSRLDMKMLEKFLENSSISDEVKRRVRENAAETFRTMADEKAKRQQRAEP